MRVESGLMFRSFRFHSGWIEVDLMIGDRLAIGRV